MSFKLEIISPLKELFSGEVKQVILPSSNGELTILTGHMPLACSLKAGRAKIRTEREILEYSIGKGFFSIEGDRAILITEDVLSTEEISEE